MGDNWWKRGKNQNKKPRAEDIPDQISDWELDKGGWRYDAHNTGYSLNWEQLLEYERTSEKIVDDKKFDDWFTEFRKKSGITSRSYSGGGSYRSWEDDDYAYEEPKKGKWLSSWWAADTYKGLGYSSKSKEDVQRLAVVLQAVRTTVRAVDDTVPSLTVKWAEKDDISYTDFGAHEIAINPEPVRGKKYEDGEAIDITTGFALHEASHSKYTRDPFDLITKPEPLRPLAVAGTLLNFAEDIRIEGLTSEEFPGFAGYFERSLEWAWSFSKDKLPTEYGKTLGEQVRSAFIIVRFKEALPRLTDPSFKDEIPWWLAWRDEYIANKIDARACIQKALDHLAKDPSVKKEMEELAKGEKEREEALGDLREAFKEALRKFQEGHMKEDKTCVNGHDENSGLDDTASEEVRRLVSEGLTIEQVFIKTPNGQGNVPFHITRPTENEHSKRAYIGKPKPILHRLKAALVFRQELPRYTNRLLKSGNLDEEELWRWKDHDYRVFNEEVIAARPQTQLSFLVDMSGSMYGEKLRTAQELAQLLVWAVKEMEGVDSKVFGHTGDTSNIATEMFRLWEPGEPLTRLGLIQTLPHGNNYDGHAIAWCAKELIERGQPDEQRLLIVLSDGYPAGSSYGGRAGEQHVHDVVAWADSHGVKVIQIAIDPSVEPERQARMFKEFIQFTNLDDVPRQLTRLLSKFV